MSKTFLDLMHHLGGSRSKPLDHQKWIWLFRVGLRIGSEVCYKRRKRPYRLVIALHAVMAENFATLSDVEKRPEAYT